MPLHWQIDHSNRRVTAVLRGTTSEQDLYDFLGEVIAAGAMPYAKLLDVSAAVRSMATSRIGPIATTTRLYSRMGLGSVGPLAIVVANAAGRKTAEDYVLLSDAARLVRIFGQTHEAEAWLQSLPQGLSGDRTDNRS
ncbi:MAG TPA: hypothetical protein VEC60_06470 [Reyranella sp.]|nr:hypothetical protein [Reyranella sp.]